MPWWAIAALTVGALLLVRLNWPGAYRYAWYDHDNTGWYVYRGWGDPVILSSFAALLAGLAARWVGPIALGIVAGCAASLIEGGLVILGAGISWNETGTWVATVAVAAAMAAVLLIVLRPAGWRFWPVAALTAVLIVAGGLLLLASALIKHPDGISWFTVTKLAVLEPLVTVGLAWLAVAATETRTRIWLTTAVTTYAVISIIGSHPRRDSGRLTARLPHRPARQRAGGGRRAHPRTAPSVAPLMNWRAKIAKTITSGTIAINAPVITML